MFNNKTRGVKRRIAATVGAVALALSGTVAIGGEAAFAADPHDMPTGNGSLTVHKFEQPDSFDPNHSGTELTVPGTWNPLGNVDFDIQPIANVDLSTEAGWTTVNGYSTDTSTIPGVDLGTATSGTTNDAGELSFTGLPVGAYLVTETDFKNATNPDGSSANVTSGSAPFVVTIPVPQGDGTWLMDVHAYPKNSVTNVDKTVSEPTGNGIGSVLTWTITADIPTLKPGETFEDFAFGDVLDGKLTYVAGSAKVTADGAEVGIDDTTAGQNVAVAANAAGLDVLQANQGKKATFTFETTVIAAGEIVNEANVYINDPGKTNGITTPQAFSYWGPVEILKHVQGDTSKTLAGAVFTVHANAADAATGANPISVGGVTEFTTAADGTVLIDGLFVGNEATASKDYW